MDELNYKLNYLCDAQEELFEIMNKEIKKLISDNDNSNLMLYFNVCAGLIAFGSNLQILKNKLEA